MAALDEVAQKNVALAGLRSLIGDVLWVWIREHEDDDVFTVRVWIIRKTFKVRDLEPFAVLLLGPAPIQT